MPRVLVFVLVVAVAVGCFGGCVPLPSKQTTHGGPIWAQPGSATTFKWSERETTTRIWGPDLGPKHDVTFSTSESSDVDRTWITATDPRTSTSYRLSAVRAKVFPFYWNEALGVLWVQDARHSVLGLTAKDPIYAPGGIDYHARDLPAPWLLGFDLHATYLFNAQTNTTFALPARRGGNGTPVVDGNIVRFIRADDVDGAVTISETVIDWSGPQPVRRPDVVWTTPSLRGDAGRRDAFTVMPDGRHFVEVVTTDTSNVYVYDMIDGGPVTTLPLDYIDHRIWLEPIAGDVVFVKMASGNCFKGTMVATVRKRTRPIDDGVCVAGVGGTPGGRWVQIGDHSGYVDDSLGVVDLGVSLKYGLAVDATTFVYAHPDATTKGLAIDKLDLATGTITPLAAHATASDQLIGIYDDTLVFIGAANTLVTTRIGATADAAHTKEIALPAPVTDGPDGPALAYETAGIGNEIERTKMWIAFVGGGTTTSRAVFGATIGLQRFWRERLALSLDGFVRDESDSAFRTTDFGGSLGFAAFASHTRTGWWAGADLGVAQSTTRDKSIMDVSADGDTGASIVDVRWVPSAALRAGYKGTLFAFDVAAVAPSLADRDRGVMFIGGLSIGMFGVNR